jgi:predicted AAA+ superfamily ATPase
LKTAYDIYEDIKIIFSGSSSIDLIKGTYDLSRRAILRKLHKFSFREYLQFIKNISFEKISIEMILENPIKSSTRIYVDEPKIVSYFHEYLQY